MYFDRYDVCEAYYLFLQANFYGQGCDKYERLCKLLKFFDPRMSLSYDTLTENGKAIFDNLQQKQGVTK